MMNANEIISALTKDQIRTDLPELVVGNNVKVYQKVVEGNRTRTQMFEGTIFCAYIQIFELKKFNIKTASQREVRPLYC